MVTNVTMTGPGTTTIIDDAAAAITAQTNAITTTMTTNTTNLVTALTSMNAAVNQINNNVAALVTQSTLMSKAISDLEVVTSVAATSQSTLNALQATAVANQIKTNNFQMAATKEALERTGQPLPTLPDFDQQLKEGVTDAINLNVAASVQGAGIEFVNSTVAGTATLIAGTETYKGIGSWLSRQKDTIVGAIFPPSPREVASNAASVAGNPTIPGVQ